MEFSLVHLADFVSTTMALVSDTKYLPSKFLDQP